MSRSHSSSPDRKRQRLSSPTYDAHMEELLPASLKQLDELELQLSQRSQSPRMSSQHLSQEAKRKRARAISEALVGMAEDRTGTEDKDVTGFTLSVVNRASLPGTGAKTLGNSTSADDSAEGDVWRDNPTGDDVFGQPSGHHFSAAASALRTSTNFGFASAAALNTIDRFSTSINLAGIEHEIDRSIPLFRSAKYLPLADPITPASPLQEAQPLETDNILNSPEATPPPQDFSNWFKPLPAPVPDVRKSTNTTTLSASIFQPEFQTENLVQRPVTGFVNAGGKEWLAPSSSALQKAVMKMQYWEEEENGDVVGSSAQSESLLATDILALATPTSPRKVLGALDNVVGLPDSPSPAGSSTSATRALMLSQSEVGARPSVLQVYSKGKMGTKAFKSPLIVPPASSPLYPSSTRPPISQRGPHPLAAAPISAPAPSASTSSSSMDSSQSRSPQQPSVVGLGMTPQRRVAQSKFVTPFKMAVAPGATGKSVMDASNQTSRNASVVAGASRAAEAVIEKRSLAENVKRAVQFFNLTPPMTRMTLTSSGLVPQSYTKEELEDMGINMAELSRITPDLALYYSFHTADARPIHVAPQFGMSPVAQLGPSAAFNELIRRGCSLATRAWVDNHWGLILWKLAGMACLEPEREMHGERKRWCWEEVIGQLLYRYERELLGGSRPPFKLIATHDVPASCPMILCISAIAWTEEEVAEDGTLIPRFPELELSDGWYRLRVQVDEAIARATRKGVLRVGRKLAVGGARLSSTRKEPTEILDAFQTTHLVISGNSSHLAPWHAKLGFQATPFVATLGSLTPDGGTVAHLDLVVIKTYPIAFLEFIEDENGEKYREGPRNEKEEEVENNAWKDRRELEESKLRNDLEKKLMILDGYAERLERMSCGRFNPKEDDEPPHNIDDLYDELEDTQQASAIFKRLNHEEAGWLARLIRSKCDTSREIARDEIDRDLQRTCPPREVRSFRVLVVQDARTVKRPKTRSAQLTVWDVASLSFGEGHKAGEFLVDERFMVSNLIPTQQKAWMSDGDPEEMVYLATRRDTRWKKMRSYK